jgi:PUA-domain protein
MPQKPRRYSLKSKQAKLILNEVSEKLKINVNSIFESKSNIDIVEADAGKIFLVDGKPLFFKAENRILPMLFFHDFVLKAPKIIVDMGAVPHVCNGADLMAPGIVRVEGEFAKGDLVLIADENHEKPLALGESLYDAESVRNVKAGAVVKNIHFVSDKIWNFAKTIV